MKNLISFILILVIFNASGQDLNIIPQPVKVQVQKEFFTISANTVALMTDDGEKASVDFLNDYLRQFYGFSLNIAKEAKGNYIRLSSKRIVSPPKEGQYTMSVTPTGITINGDTYRGTFYGVQTLIQLLPVQAAPSLKIQCASIEDYPRFQYRGLHLDVARHFFPVEFIKKYIDYIALHKLNYFHWHLTDDQGWRIEIKKYPLLTEVGGCRDGTIIGRHPGTGNDNLRHCGFYTQEQIRDIVKYASDRYITIIPEIELPGHSSAAIAAYPLLSCFPEEGPKKVVQTWGVFRDVFCPTEFTFNFLEDVVDEVVELFPSRYVHIGGDESPKDNWKRSEFCQKLIKEKGLKDEHELQSYFIQRMEKYLNGKGKQLIGWDEILEGGLAPNAIVISWRGEEGGIVAAEQDHDVIMTPGTYVYFDHAQVKKEDSVNIGGYLPLKRVYNYEPVPAALTVQQGKHILGAQANVWTEYMKNPRKVEYMIFPRLSALSEVLWSPKESRNWDAFAKKLLTQFKRYDLWKANYSRAFFKLKGE